MRLKCTRGFGIVEGPDGEEIDVEEAFEADQETSQYLLDNYPGMEVIESGTLAEASETDETPTPDADTTEDTYTCVGKDGDCSREVDEKGGRCWQHS